MPSEKVTNIRGKGGNFDTRTNPFATKGNTGNRPSLASMPLLGAVLDGVLLGGAAIMIGSTRDGGALVITIFDGEQRHRTYCSNERELLNALESLQAAYSEL